jgi:hypothetical protein
MRSVAKGNYIKGVGGIKHALAHVRYLQMRGGDDRDHALGGKRLFINANREAISGSEVNERIKQLDESKVVIHRIVLSPGIEGVDMDAYTRAVMTELERSKGLDIEYYATGHKNTDHDHEHVVLLGRDKHGRQVTLNRRNYQTIREAGDRYLEKHHQYSRYLDKELDAIINNSYKHDRGDKHFEWLLDDLKSNLTLEECDQQRRDPSPGFIKEFAIYALPDSECIVRDDIVYTKFSSLQELLDLNEKLTKSQVERLPQDQYKKMWTWIGNKKQFGDDYYERTAEDGRIFQQFEEDLKRSLSTDNSPPKSYRQYIFESRGRLLDSHEKYTINTQRLQLEKHVQAFDESGNTDLNHRQGLIEQLEWLDAMLEERIESRKGIPKVQRSKEEDKSMNSNFAKEKNLSDSEERDRWGSELVERAWKKLLGDQPETYDKASPQGKMAIQEALGREISKITAEDHQQGKQEPNYWGIEHSPEQEHKLNEDLTKDYDSELSQRAWKNVTNDRYILDELRPEIREQASILWQQEIEKVYAEDKTLLPPETTQFYRENGMDHVVEEYEISVHSRAYDQAFDHRTWNLDDLEPHFQEDAIARWHEEIMRLRAEDQHSHEQPGAEQHQQSEDTDEQTIDLTVNTDQNSPGDTEHQHPSTFKNKSQESDRKDLDLNESFHSPDRPFDLDNNQSDSNINQIIFGDQPAITLSQNDKTPLDHQIDLWQQIAFEPDLDRNLPELTDNLFDRNNTLIDQQQNNKLDYSQLSHQSLDQIMSQQVQQNMDRQIQQSFSENQYLYNRAELAAPKEVQEQEQQREQERRDDGREHSR